MNRTIATLSRPAMQLLSRLRRLGEDGVSAVEFALIAPILFLSLLAMVDVGFAIHERMTIDHVLRAGAQEAMKDPGKTVVLQVLDVTAAKGFLPGDVPNFTVTYPVCTCPNDNAVFVTCSISCPGPTATSRFYHLLGEKTYDGIFMSIDLGPSVRVQVR